MMCTGMSVFFFKQKTAYDMRISDWSSDVCSSDLHRIGHLEHHVPDRERSAVQQVSDLLLQGILAEGDIRRSLDDGLQQPRKEPDKNFDAALRIGIRYAPFLEHVDRADPQKGDRKSTRLNSSN